MRCKYARRRGVKIERWRITLYWAGRKWVRYSYDDRVPLNSEFLAQRLAHAINSEIERLGPGFSPKSWFAPSSNELRMENYARAWLERKTDLAPASRISFRSIIERTVIPVLGELDIRSIKRGHLEDFLQRLPAIFGPKTRASHLAVIRNILGDAFRREDIQRVPPFPVMRVPTKEIRWLTIEQQRIALDSIDQEHQPIFRFICFYGCRPGEARALQWDCVDWVKKTITIRRTFSGEAMRETTKSGASRVLPLMPEIETMLRELRGLGGFVFRTERGKPYPHCRLTRIWRKAVADAGLPHIHLYSLRHSRAMRCMADEWPMEYIGGLLGHSKPQTTRRYARANAEMIRERLR